MQNLRFSYICLCEITTTIKLINICSSGHPPVCLLVQRYVNFLPGPCCYIFTQLISQEYQRECNYLRKAFENSIYDHVMDTMGKNVGWVIIFFITGWSTSPKIIYRLFLGKEFCGVTWFYSRTLSANHPSIHPPTQCFWVTLYHVPW